MAGWSAVSGVPDGEPDILIIAEGSDGFQGHVPCALDGPFVALLEQQGADEADDGGFVGE